jgi:hypothetical protein
MGCNTMLNIASPFFFISGFLAVLQYTKSADVIEISSEVGILV